MRSVYFIRGQGLGVVYDRPFSEPPPDEVVEHYRELERRLHGTGPDGSPRERWVRVVEVPLYGPGDEAPLPPLGEAPGPGGQAAAPELGAAGRGRVG